MSNREFSDTTRRLVDGYARLENPGHWIKQVRMNTHTDGEGQRFNQYCMAGAVGLDYGSGYGEEFSPRYFLATSVREKTRGKHNEVEAFNDHVQTSHRHVLGVMRRAIELSRRHDGVIACDELVEMKNAYTT